VSRGRERTKTFQRKGDAQRWINPQEADKARDQWIDPQGGRTRFEEYALSWLRTKNDVSEGTKANHRSRLTKHAIPFLGMTHIAKIRPKDVREFATQLTEAGLAPSTVKSSLLTVQAVLRQAVEDDLIGSNPCERVKAPRDIRDREMRFLSPPQIQTLATEIDPRYQAAIFVAAYGGLRAGEIWALRKDRLDLADRSLVVVESVRDASGQLVFGPTKTNRPRRVSVPKFLTAMLEVQMGNYPSKDGLIFSAAEGGPVRHGNFMRRHFVKATKASGLAGLRFHDLRHTCAALLIDAGRHMEEVKAHLGHASIKVTSDTYGHLFPAAFTAIADSLEKTFSQGLDLESYSDDLGA
jgi:integrase